MRIDQLLADARDVLTVRRVFGDPYERDGVTIVPVASVSGGGGGGGGQDGDGQQGEGGGFGMSAKPAGVYVIENGTVRWRPAVDVNRVVTAGTTLLVAGLLTWVRLARLRAKRARG